MASWFNRNLLQDIRTKSGIDKLNSREKWVLFGGIGFVLCFLAVQLVVVPVIDARNNLLQSIARKKQELVEIKNLQQEYRTLKSKEGTIQARINQRGAGFTLFTFLDQQANRAKVKKQIKYMKPSTIDGDELNEAMVEMKLQQISLNDLVGFLRLIESEQEVVFIKRFSIQESGDAQGFFDAILQVVTFEKKG
ncbi:type II secretion system protein M [Desulfopila sp. IMCC35006]|uniref:type II secretion system protein GspM n=1 Tax=Desulfopila sp. IMCC35006 TaxID=2569542 RepID=UPI0010AB5CE3|nr:type II secretion system protein GspM [Desulfopila sp. IMCC35006]TKB28296.1 type II secretion system protein M [Desulfopila sp. IMCC35006]